MKKAILTLAAVSALTATAASAQPGRNDRDFGRPPIAAPGPSIDARQAMLSQRISVGQRNGTITRREAVRLNAELREIDRLEWSFRRSGAGLDRREVTQLDTRLDRLAAQIRFDRNDRDNRQFGAGYGRF